MVKITQINSALAPKAFKAIASRIAESKNGMTTFKGGCYEAYGNEVWHVGFLRPNETEESKRFENTWTDSSFGL